MKELLVILRDILFAIDKVNANQKLDYSAFLKNLKNFDQELKTLLTSNTLATVTKAKILHDTKNMLKSFTDALKEDSMGSFFYNYSKVDSNIAKKYYKYSQKLDPQKTGPIYATLRDYANQISGKSELITAFADMEKNLITVLNLKDDMQSLSQIDKLKINTAIETSIQNYDRRAPRKELEACIDFFISKEKDAITAQLLTEDIFAKAYFTDACEEAYKKGYKEFNSSINLLGNNKVNAQFTAKTFHEAVDLKNSHYAPLSQTKYAEKLYDVAKNIDDIDYAFAHRTKTYVRHTEYFFYSAANFSSESAYTRPNHKYGDLFAFTTEESLAIKTKPSLITRSIQAVKQSLLKKTLGRIIFGPEMLVYDLSSLGILGVVGIADSTKWVAEEMGWKEKGPETYSKEFYEQRLAALENTKKTNDLIINNPGLYKSEKIQMLEKQQYIVDNAIRLTQFNIRTTDYCGLGTDKINALSEDMVYYSSQIEYLQNQIENIRTSNVNNYLENRAIFGGAEALSEMRNPLTTISTIEKQIDSMAEKYAAAHESLSFYQRATARLQCEDIYNKLCKDEGVENNPEYKILVFKATFSSKK